MARIQLSTFLLYVLVGLVASNRRCMECRDMPMPWDCYTTTICAPGQRCELIKKITDSGYVLYDSGCRGDHICDGSGKRDVAEVAPKKRGADINLCAECCDTDFCNLQGCMAKLPPLPTRGPYCFSCAAQNDVQCRDVVNCQPTEECILVNSTDLPIIDQMHIKKSGCVPKLQCNAVLSVISRGKKRDASPGGLGSSNAEMSSGAEKRELVDRCPFCCDTDFCNDNCYHNV